MGKPVPVLYLNINGAIRKSPEELGRPIRTVDDVEIYDGVPALLSHYKEKGYRIVAYVAEGDVCLGKETHAEASAHLLETYHRCDSLFDRIMICSHHPDHPDPEYAVCWCHPPRFGLIVEAVHSMNQGSDGEEFFPPHMALLVGATDTDAQMADNANIEFRSAEQWRSEAPQ